MNAAHCFLPTHLLSTTIPKKINENIIGITGNTYIRNNISIGIIKTTKDSDTNIANSVPKTFPTLLSVVSIYLYSRASNDVIEYLAV